VAASFVLSNSATSSVRALSKMTAGSPFGIACRSRSCARRSLSYVRSRLLTREKIAVLAPMPRASESAATVETIGVAGRRANGQPEIVRRTSDSCRFELDRTPLGER
jgi:hypothetical protein